MLSQLKSPISFKGKKFLIENKYNKIATENIKENVYERINLTNFCL